MIYYNYNVIHGGVKITNRELKSKVATLANRLSKANGYFFLIFTGTGLSALLSGAGLAFGWNPLGPKSLIFLSADSSYSASLQIGFIPRWKRRCFTALGDIPNFSDISLIVNPFITFISDILTDKLKYFKNFLKNA